MATLRFYLVHKTGTGTFGDVFRPKYIGDIAGLKWSSRDFPADNTAIVGAFVEDAQHAALILNSDLTAVPANLDAQIGGAPTAAKAALEALNIPAGWMTSGMTWRTALRVCLNLGVWWQWFYGRYRRSFYEAGITLDTRINQLTQTQRNALTDLATDKGLSIAGITGTTTIRLALKLLLDQMPAVRLAGEMF